MHIHLFGHIFRLLYSDILLYIYFLQKKTATKTNRGLLTTSGFQHLLREYFTLTKINIALFQGIVRCCFIEKIFVNE